MQTTLVPEERAVRFSLRDIVLGALAGIIGGLAMGLVAMITAAAYGLNVWRPLEEIAGVFSPALMASADTLQLSAIIVGTLVHFGLSALLGVLFVVLYRGVFNLPSTMMAFPLAYGFIYGLVIWGVSGLITSGISISARDFTPSFIVQHLVFGLVVGLFYGAVRPARAYLPRY